jgi:hypothetical protein
VTGTLVEEFRTRHFFADVRGQNSETLLPPILSSLPGSAAFFFLSGPRSSGKKTRVDVACNQLREQGVMTLCATLQSVNCGTVDLFWRSLCSSLRCANLSDMTSHSFDSAEHFCDLFAINGTGFQRPVILFLDSFDLLHSQAPSEVLTSVLGTFRRNRELGKNTHLRCVIGVGTSGLSQLTGGEIGSPFNVHSTVLAPCFTQEQVCGLFRDYTLDRNVKLDNRIAPDIFLQTRGHAGSVSFIGRFIDCQLLGREWPEIRYEAWVRCLPDVIESIANRYDVRRLISELQLPEKEGKSQTELKRVPMVHSARKLLVTFLHTTLPVTVGSAEELPLARFLASEGALVAMARPADTFAVQSPIVRAILCKHVLPLEKRAFPSSAVPIVNGRLDVGEALCMALRCFDRRHCIDQRLTVAQVEVFQTEFFAVFKSWFPPHLQIHLLSPIIAAANHVSPSRSEHADLFIPEIGSQHVVLLELAANSSEDSVTEHIMRARRNAACIGAKEMWTIHFSTDELEVWPRVERGEGGDVAVCVMRVKYDYDWTAATIHIDAGAPEAIKFE